MVILVAKLVRQYPDFLTFISAWRMGELEQLPNAKENTALMQGRCQVLHELERFMKEAPQATAKS